MHEKGSRFSVSAHVFLLFSPLPFLSLPITSSSLFLFLPQPFLLKMGRSLPCGSARPVVSSVLRAKGREVVTESELLPPEEGAVCGHFVSRLLPTGLGRRDPGSPPEAPPLPTSPLAQLAHRLQQCPSQAVRPRRGASRARNRLHTVFAHVFLKPRRPTEAAGAPAIRLRKEGRWLQRGRCPVGETAPGPGQEGPARPVCCPRHHSALRAAA